MLRKKQREYEKLILSTSKVEREILAQYLTEDSTTLAFDMRDGIVNGLIAKGNLYRASKATNPISFDFDTNIQPLAWDYIKNHPDLLQGIVPPNIGRHQIRL